MDVDLFDVGEFGVAEPPWDLDAGVVGHAAGAEAGDHLGGDGLVVDAGAGDGGLDHGVEFLFADADEVPVFRVVVDSVFSVVGEEADFEDHAEIDYGGGEVFTASVMRQGVLVGISWEEFRMNAKGMCELWTCSRYAYLLRNCLGRAIRQCQRWMTEG